jgi:hypothetical protein
MGMSACVCLHCCMFQGHACMLLLKDNACRDNTSETDTAFRLDGGVEKHH